MDTGRVVDRTLNLYVRPAIFAQSLFGPAFTLPALLRLNLRYPVLKSGHDSPTWTEQGSARAQVPLALPSSGTVHRGTRPTALSPLQCSHHARLENDEWQTQ